MRVLQKKKNVYKLKTEGNKSSDIEIHTAGKLFYRSFFF